MAKAKGNVGTGARAGVSNWKRMEEKGGSSAEVESKCKGLFEKTEGAPGFRMLGGELQLRNSKEKWALLCSLGVPHLRT